MEERYRSLGLFIEAIGGEVPAVEYATVRTENISASVHGHKLAWMLYSIIRDEVSLYRAYRPQNIREADGAADDLSSSATSSAGIPCDCTSGMPSHAVARLTLFFYLRHGLHDGGAD